MRLAPALLLAAACTTPRSAPTTPTPPPGSAPTTTPPTGSAPATAAKLEKVRTVEGITEYKLPNGLQVLLFPDASQSTVTVEVVYRVGSRHEGYGETGMAHLIEHMMFKGTKKLRDIGKLLDGKGAQENASTWTDRTNYFETLPATDDNLDWSLGMEADRMVNSTFLQEDLSSEFSVVRNEFERNENHPMRVLSERVASTAFLWHNYGKSTIGSRQDIERVPATTLRRFYAKFYQPDNATLVIAGKFDEARAIRDIETMFGTITKPTRVLDPSYTVEPVQDGERTVTLRRNGDLAGLMVAYHTVGAASPDYPAVQAALDLLAHKPSGRLYKKLVETKLVANLEADQLPFRDPWITEIEAELRDPRNLDKVQQIVTSEIEGLATAKIDDKEVERWKNGKLKELDLAMSNSQELALLLTEAIAIDDWRAMFAYKARVAKVTVEDVHRVAKAFFKPSNRTVGQFIPSKDNDRAPLVETPDIRDTVKGIEGGTSVAQGEAFTASLENIEKRTARTELKGGLKAAFLSKKTRGNKVELQLSLHWGDEKSLANKPMIGAMLAALLQRGTTTKTYEQIKDLEDKLKAEIQFSGNAAGLDIQITTLRDNLPAALDLVADMLTKPAFPDKELEIMRQQQLAGLEEQRQQPEAVSYLELQSITQPWPKGDPRYQYSIAERIAIMKNMQLGDVKSFYRDFVGASHGQLVVIGDFDQAAISAQAEKLFSGWKSAKPYARLSRKAFGVKGMTKSIDIKDKEMTMLMLSHDVTMKDSDPDYPAWVVMGQILGGDSGSRVWTRLREKEGLSYGAGVRVSASALDEVGGVLGYALVAPQNLAKAKASMLDEITKMTTGPVTDAELGHAKEGWLKSLDTELSDDDAVADLLNRELFNGRTLAWYESLRTNVAKVTAADVERVAKKWLHPDRLIVVEAGDQAKMGAPKGPQDGTPKQDPGKK